MAEMIYFLAPYPEGSAPSQRFRFEQYVDYLRERGFLVEIHPFYDYNAWQTLYTEGNYIRKTLKVISCFLKRFGLLFKLHKANYLFIHREVAHIGPPIFEWLIAKVLRRKFIYDFDDAIWLPNYSETNSRFHWVKAYWKVKYCMKWAHSIAAGNAYLATYARQFNPNVYIVPTSIDTKNHHNIVVNHQANPTVIGWTGSHTTMRYLDALIPILKKLETLYTFQFIVISNENPRYDLRSLSFIKWCKETEIDDLSKIHIGIMPLQNDIWTEGKCGFKGLQYMSLGMATLMSPVGVNCSIVENGINGFLVETPAEWEEKLELLLKDRVLRKQLGENGRKTIQNRFSVEALKETYDLLINTLK
jgi:glycosyltransferase involved in cell wall biosynthesis